MENNLNVRKTKYINVLIAVNGLRWISKIQKRVDARIVSMKKTNAKNGNTGIKIILYINFTGLVS